MTHKITCDLSGCDSWTRGADGDTMITLSQSSVGEDKHFCSLEHLVKWANALVGAPV